jgi:hypothetical protein
MKILFIHQNFPGQFKFLAPALAKAGHEVVAMTMQKLQPGAWQGYGWCLTRLSAVAHPRCTPGMC